MSFHPWWPAGWPHPHAVFEPLAYLLGGLALSVTRRPDPVGDSMSRAMVAVGGLVGAALGSKVGYWLSDPVATWAHRSDPAFLMGGKTIVGGLLGGWLAVELVKRAVGVTASTGDRFVTPLAVGLAVGRLGCFFSGVEDGTHGIATAGPWGMDLGDGLLRHPTALYEVVVVVALGLLARGPRNGDRFRVWLCGYLGWRVLVEPLKTQPVVALGLSGIQWMCVVGLVALALDRVRVLRLRTIEEVT